MKITVSLFQRDSISIEFEKQNDEVVYKKVSGIGCTELLKCISNWRQSLPIEFSKIKLPVSTNHSSLLLKKAILLAADKWHLPYDEEELCHCRAIKTSIIEDAILKGAHTPQKVSEITSASTACGTCRPNVELLIDYVLKKDN